MFLFGKHLFYIKIVWTLILVKIPILAELFTGLNEFLFHFIYPKVNENVNTDQPLERNCLCKCVALSSQ